MAGLGAIAGVASAVGGMMQAKGQAEAAEAQADVKHMESQAQLRKGLEETAVKQREALQEDKKREKVISDQRAGFASSGGGVTGSARHVMTETNTQGIFNRKVKLWEGAQQLQSRTTQAEILQREGQALRNSAQTIRQSGVISAIGGVAGAVGGLGGKGGGGGGGGSFFYG